MRIVTDELGNRRPLREVVLPAGTTRPDMTDLAGAKVYVEIADPLTAGTRAYSTDGAVVVAIGTTSSAAALMPALGETGEVMVHPTVAIALAIGGADVGAAVLATTPLRFEAGVPIHFRPTASQTHYRVIGEAAGVLRLVPVA